jgi:hypothetical protein
MAKDKNQSAKQEITFSTVLAVVDYLKESKYKVAKSTVYNHKKEQELRPREDGLFYLSDVKKYAAHCLSRIDGSSGSDADRMAAEKAQVELDKEKEKLKQIQHKNKLLDGAYVPREAFEQELAKRAIVFKSDIENFIRAGAEFLIALVGGDPAKAPALIEHQLDAAADWLDRYAGDKEFKVPVPATMAADAALQDRTII